MLMPKRGYWGRVADQRWTFPLKSLSILVSAKTTEIAVEKDKLLHKNAQKIKKNDFHQKLKQRIFRHSFKLHSTKKIFLRSQPFLVPVNARGHYTEKHYLGAFTLKISTN